MKKISYVMNSRNKTSVVLAMCAVAVLASCRPSDDGRFHTVARGTFRIAERVDSTRDFSGFEIVLASQEDGDVDTLGTAVTDVDGNFELNIAAREGGVFPLIVRRMGALLGTSQFVVAEGDTAVISGTFPLNGRRLRIVSPENSAWMAYVNSKAQYNASMLRLLETGDSSRLSIPQISEQTASIFWSLRTLYPGTFGAEIASAESIQLLEGWNDALAVDRVQELELNNVHIVEAVRAARRAESRLAGLDASVALIEYFIQNLSDSAQKAALTAEIVVAYSDSVRSKDALEAALRLRRDFPTSEWASWAGRATYELENLMPGMPAPAFSVETRDGQTFSLAQAKNRYFILEFYDPQNSTFLKELAERNIVYAAMNPLIFETLSVSLEPDIDINEALFEEVAHAGKFAFAGGLDSEIGQAYNIHVIPTRFLIDPDGNIMAKYTGFGLRPMEGDLVALVRQISNSVSDPK